MTRGSYEGLHDNVVIKCVIHAILHVMLVYNNDLNFVIE